MDLRNLPDEELKKLKKRQEILDALVNYQGEDRVVKIEEALEQIKNMPKRLRVDCKIPTINKHLDGFRCGELVVVSGPTGHGKCLGKGTPVIMSDGTSKKVEDVKKGDLLMGDDSTQRKVLSITKGRSPMYKIKQKNGDSYVVNESHILSLQRTNDCSSLAYNKIDVPLKEYIESSKTFKHIHKGYKVPVNWKEKDVPIEPYFLGLWLGDGTSAEQSVTCADKECITYLEEYGKRLKLHLSKTIHHDSKSDLYRITSGIKGKPNELLDNLRALDLIDNKHVPLTYKTNSRANRLELLAGLIDSDGSVNKPAGLSFSNKNYTLAKDVAFVARSLGFAASIKERVIDGVTYYRVPISGDCSRIPLKIKRKRVPARRQIKNVLRTGIEIEPLGMGDYFGFTLDGNGRFLLGDFTVTHNSTLLQSFTYDFNEIGANCLWFSYEVGIRDLVKRFAVDMPSFALPLKTVESNFKWMRQRIWESIAKHDTKVVFIDHLHYLLDMSYLAKVNTSLAIGMLMRDLKKLAVETDTLIFLVSHLSKTKLEEEPDLDDIRDSSFIGQESDIVIVIYREKSNGEYGKSWVKVAKNRRNGTIGSVPVVLKKGRYCEQSLQDSS